MTSKYQLREVTPEVMRCISGIGCLAIYEANNPEARDCLLATCPDIQARGNVYLIIGKQVDPKDAGLEKKVGEGEVLIEVPRELIDGRIR